MCRVVRGEVMKLKNRPFVLAAKVAGVGNFTIIYRHILPNVTHLAIIYFTTLFAASVMLEVTASYLGLGAQNFPSWGMMISDGQQRLWAGVWWEITFLRHPQRFFPETSSVLRCGDCIDRLCLIKSPFAKHPRFVTSKLPEGGGSFEDSSF